MTTRATMHNRVASHAVHHARRPEPDDEDEREYSNLHDGVVPRTSPSMPRIHFLERPLPDWWWDSPEAALTERKRGAARRKPAPSA